MDGGGKIMGAGGGGGACHRGRKRTMLSFDFGVAFAKYCKENTKGKCFPYIVKIAGIEKVKKCQKMCEGNFALFLLATVRCRFRP